jgi:hypothetical protein
MNKYLIFITLISFILSCNNNDKTNHSVTQTQETPSVPQTPAAYSEQTKPVFFDLKSFIKQEIERLKNIKTVEKTVTVNGKSETKKVSISNWEDELAPFTNSDINRPAWKDKYRLKEGLIAQEGKFKRYEATDENLKTRVLGVKLTDDDKILTVFIENNEESAVSSASQKLTYNVGKSYKIESKQKTLTSKEDNVVIEVKLPQNVDIQ